MGLFLGLKLYSIDLAVCLCTNIMQFYHCCSVVELEVRDGDSPRSSFIVENCFHYSDFFPYEVENCSMSMENCVGILMGIKLGL